VLTTADAAPHLEHVAEALGGQEAGRSAAAGEDGVGGNRGAVDDHRELGEESAELQLQPGGDLAEAAEQRLGRVVRGAGRLVRPVGAVALIDDDEVGEGAADVDPGQVGHTARLIANSSKRNWVYLSSDG